jgi:hypothetical protein
MGWAIQRAVSAQNVNSIEPVELGTSAQAKFFSLGDLLGRIEDIDNEGCRTEQSKVYNNLVST